MFAKIGATRTEEDLAPHLAAVLQHNRQSHLIMDSLNTHYAESVLRLVGAHMGFAGDLGVNGHHGILHNAESRQAALIITSATQA